LAIRVSITVAGSSYLIPKYPVSAQRQDTGDNTANADGREPRATLIQLDEKRERDRESYFFRQRPGRKSLAMVQRKGDTFISSLPLPPWSDLVSTKALQLTE
jgi:hypothetical protein